MTKIRIYIDFEAISSPFNYNLKINQDFPYAYSLGMIIGNKFVSKTYIFDFNKYAIEDVFEVLRKQILYDVQHLKKDRGFLINKNTVEFAAYGKSLEQKILNQVYQGISIVDLSKNSMISLSKATKKFIPNAEYFPELRKYIAKYFKPDFILRRGLNQDGAIAALAGALLCNDVKKMTHIWPPEIDTRILIKEIKEYSVGDVYRMYLVTLHQQHFLEISQKWSEAIESKRKNSANIQKGKKMIEYLKSLNPEWTIEEIIQHIQGKNEVLEQNNAAIISDFS